jgi:FAD/FMN-containing dehydrogenase
VGYGPAAVVSPVSVEEVELLAEAARRHSVCLAPEGAGTASVPGSLSPLRVSLPRG